MELTLVHWSAHPTDSDASCTTSHTTMPFEIEIGVPDSGAITMYGVITDDAHPHLMPDEELMVEGNVHQAAIIGIPAAWDGFMVITCMETPEGTLIAFHNNPEQPSELYADYRASKSNRAMYLCMRTETI